MSDDGVELADLRRAVGEVDDIARETAGVVSEVAPAVATLEEKVAELAGHVATLLAGAENTPAEDPALTAAKTELGMRPEPPGPWAWPLLDRAQAQAAWDALARWVGQVLVAGYELTRADLPDCWPRHSRMVAELTWLRHGYLEANLRGAAASKASDWHLRGLPGALTNIAAAIPCELDLQGMRRPLCGPGHHLTRHSVHDKEDQQQRRRPASCEHWCDAWREVRDADLAGRRPAPAK